jgi:hypothetical protein
MPKVVRESLEHRLATVERRLDELQLVLASPMPGSGWRQSVGVFTDRPGVLEILEEAQKLWEADRRRSRPRRRARAKS